MSERMDRERIGGGRLNGMILISLLFHGVVLSLLFFTPSFPSPKLTFGPVYTVSLVNFSGSVLEQKSGTAAMKELLEASRSETVFKKRLEPEPVIPIRSLESRRKQDQTLEKAMEEIRKRAAAGCDPKTAGEGLPGGQVRSRVTSAVARGCRDEREDEGLLRDDLVPDQGKMGAASGDPAGRGAGNGDQCNHPPQRGGYGNEF